jgi:PIN domain nuclease of toxin-antitoxin system
MKALLDTCTFLWMAIDAPDLSASAREIVLDSTNELYLSAASAWEVALKYARGKLVLPEPPSRYIPSRRVVLGLTALVIEEEAVLALERLPVLHRDPFDRLLVCQALIHGLALLTPDPQIQQYPVRTIW